MELTKEFVTKCNKLAESFSNLDRGDLEVELTKIQKQNPAEYEQVLMFLYVGMNIGLVEDL